MKQTSLRQYAAVLMVVLFIFAAVSPAKADAPVWTGTEVNNSMHTTSNTSIGLWAIAMGYNTNAAGNSATSTGYGTLAQGDGSFAGGGYYKNDTDKAAGGAAYGKNSFAYGTGAQAGSVDNSSGTPAYTGDYTLAYGENAVASKDNAIALGSNAKAEYMNSVALGSGSVVTESDGNVISVGASGAERKIIHVADGIVELGSTDAVNGGQLHAVKTMVLDEQARAKNAEKLLSNAISANTNEIREVGAMSAALAGLHYAEPSGEAGDKLAAAASFGGYRGESAAAIGLAYKPNQNMMVSASTSVGQSQNAYNAGVSYRFGKGQTAATKAELQKQVKYVNEENRVMKAQIVNLSSENADMKAENVAIKAENAAQNKKIQLLEQGLEELKKQINK